HAKAMVHYDIKPVQFMLSDEGDLRLIDLGSVRHDGEEIKSGFQMTPGYIYLPAPRDGRLCFDSAADIYALGKTFASIMLRTVGMKGQEISAVMGAMTDEEEKGLTTMLSENNPKLGQMLHHYKARSDKSCLDTLKERLPGTSANKHFINEVVARCLSPTQEESEFKAPMLLKALLEYDTKRKSFLSRAQERLSKKKQIK
ncbi:hypothetical protein KY363_06945, partial [Candidatus Woesearchaeota archaeon]|nr:hypothetical protein [Candidatus Woesearchaeota archaeon]